MSNRGNLKSRSLMTNLRDSGFELLPSDVPLNLRITLRETVFSRKGPGKRCLLDQPPVAMAATALHRQLTEMKLLPSSAIAIQAIAFDKTPSTNWKVAWHQDLMFPFAKRVVSHGYEVPSIKDGVHFARPPVEVLNDLLAVRLHLDDCDSTNGPLHVAPGTHTLGVIPSEDVIGHVNRHGKTACHAAEGEALLMRPLLLHSSSQAVAPKHRRVLHFVFHSGAPIRGVWAQTVTPIQHPEFRNDFVSN